MSEHTLRHESYAYLRESLRRYRPRTQRTALIAVENALLPPAAFIRLSVNVKPIFEEPYDLGEIDRILAKADLSIETILLLMQILAKLINHRDPEVALFAAESINAIEHRYNVRIQETKDRIEEYTPQAEDYRFLIRPYLELSQINRIRQVLRNFYLGEAYQYCKRLWRLGELLAEDYALLTRILLALELHQQCGTLLHRAVELRPDIEAELRFLQLEAAFARRDTRTMGRIMDRLRGLNLTAGMKRQLAFWNGVETNE
jgi:hypothetical protein